MASCGYETVEIEDQGNGAGLHQVESVAEVNEEGGAPPVQLVLDDRIEEVGMMEQVSGVNAT